MKFQYLSQNFSKENLLNLEWLETNGVGGYASSAVLGCNRRKYHGLLVGALASHVDKQVLLAKVDDSVMLNSNSASKYLSASQYVGYDDFSMYDILQDFSLETHPCYTYKINNQFAISKEILLLHGKNTVLIKYKINAISSNDTSNDRSNNSDNCLTLKLRPLFAYRSFHALSKENVFIQKTLRRLHLHNSYAWHMSFYENMPDFYINSSLAIKPHIEVNYDWYRNFIYQCEQERGYPSVEDLFNPCCLSFEIKPENLIENPVEIILAFSLEEITQKLEDVWYEELQRRTQQNSHFTGSALQQHLKKVALDFLHYNYENNTCGVVAGYPWFLDWGRDAMIALPGLTLFNNHEKECFLILKTFALHMKNGLIPNFIGKNVLDEIDLNSNAYNSVDASLWFAWAVQQFYYKTQDLDALQELLPALIDIFKHFQNGTDYDIKMRENGLLWIGDKQHGLTWMDAMVNDVPVTLRHGFVVEINALWFNFLSFLYETSKLFTTENCLFLHNEIKMLLPKIRLHFCQVFYDTQLEYLYDFVTDDEKNSDLRPNQIFAISLPFSPLPQQLACKVMEKVEEHLITPYGLRTLSPQDPKYCGAYQGGQEKRDYAYHNGTVWPWLLGHCGEALLKVYSREQVVQLLQPSLKAIKQHLFTYGIGGIAEVFSGDFPYEPNGCINQAWSVAEVLRLTYLLNQNDVV